jgi:hypothetical protein
MCVRTLLSPPTNQRLPHPPRCEASCQTHALICCLCCRGAGYDQPISGRATRKDLILFAKALKGRGGQAAVDGLDLIDPAALLVAPTATLKKGKQQLGKLLVKDMVGERANVRPDGFNQQCRACSAITRCHTHEQKARQLVRPYCNTCPFNC